MKTTPRGREIKSCIECGTEFETSRTGKTVRCPACREARRPKVATRSEFYETKAIEAKMAAYEARAKYGVGAPEYEEAVAEYTHWRKMVETA